MFASSLLFFGRWPWYPPTLILLLSSPLLCPTLKRGKPSALQEGLLLLRSLSDNHVGDGWWIVSCRPSPAPALPTVQSASLSFFLSLFHSTFILFWFFNPLIPPDPWLAEPWPALIETTSNANASAIILSLAISVKFLQSCLSQKTIPED